MTVIHEVPSSAVDVPASALAPRKKGSIWERPAIYRYGFLAFILLLWEIVGPFINPIFFSYPSKIATAAFYLTISGDPALADHRVIFYGLGFAF
jgi:ABC-type nitrate/sulfonate/bicarbonate transport system permease component